MQLTLTRVVTSEKGTFGILRRGKIPLCVTCEDPWLNNQVGESCIPAGVYEVGPHGHPGSKYKDVWIFKEVPGRTGILIHGGNTIHNTRGCILVGSGFNMFSDVPGVTNSQATLDKLRKTLPGDFTVEVINAYDLGKGVES